MLLLTMNDMDGHHGEEMLSSQYTRKTNLSQDNMSARLTQPLPLVAREVSLDTPDNQETSVSPVSQESRKHVREWKMVERVEKDELSMNNTVRAFVSAIETRRQSNNEEEESSDEEEEEKNEGSQQQQQCYTGKEAVDVYLLMGCCQDRQCAISLVRKLNEKYNLFVSETGEHFELKDDDHVLFRFTDKWLNNMRQETGREVPAINTEERQGTLADDGRMVKKLGLSRPPSISSSNQVSTKCCTTVDEDEELPTKVVETLSRGTPSFTRVSSSDVSSLSNSTASDSLDMPTLIEAFKSFAQVKDITWKMRKYENCFVGTEAVDMLVLMGYSQTREEAVQLGRTMAIQYQLFDTLSEDGGFFEDDYVFYQFNNNQYSEEPSQQISDDGEFRPTFRRRPSKLSPSYSRFVSVSSRDVMERLDMDTAGAVVQTLGRVEVKDRVHRTQVYQQCFTGSDAVSMLVDAGFAETRREAVLIGLIINDRYDLFEHVHREHYFEDGKLFYRFKRSVQEALSSGIHDKTAGHGFDFSTVDSQDQYSVQSLWIYLIRKVQVRDRMRRLRMHRQCFVGSELVDLLVMRGLAKSRGGAVRTIRVVNSQLDLFESCCNENRFEDGYTFYRFKTGNLRSRSRFPSKRSSTDTVSSILSSVSSSVSSVL